MIIPRNDKEEFEFYSKFFRNFHLNLTDDKDKNNVVLWYKKLRSDQDSLIRIKKEYLKLLLFLLQRKKIISPFSKPPKSGPLPENLDQLNLTVIAKKLCERKTSSKEAKKKLHRTADTSGDCFAVFQQVPRWGIHGFVSYSKNTNSKKSLNESQKNISDNSNTSKNEKNPFKMLFSSPRAEKKSGCLTKRLKNGKSFSEKNIVSKNGKTVTFADIKGLDKPYLARSRQGQGIISSTTFLNAQESNTTELEREIQIENLNLSENNVSTKSSSKGRVSKRSFVMSKKVSTIKNSSSSTLNKSRSVLEQLYYSSQYDTNSQKSESTIIEEVVDREKQDGRRSQNKMDSSIKSSNNSLQMQKSRNYYSLNDLQTLRSELSKLLRNSESKFKISNNEIKVSNKKTFVIKTKMADEVKKQMKCHQKQVVKHAEIKQQILPSSQKFNFDENQYFDVVDFSKILSGSPIPTTWIRCKTDSEHRSYVMRTYPTESNSSFAPKFINSSTQSISKSNPEMGELISILDSIKQYIHSAQDINSKNLVTSSNCS